MNSNFGHNYSKGSPTTLPLAAAVRNIGSR